MKHKTDFSNYKVLENNDDFIKTRCLESGCIDDTCIKPVFLKPFFLRPKSLKTTIYKCDCDPNKFD